MKKLEYTVQFVTPAFLGNAEQNAQWRTPPFKALLRQWWRVAAAQQFQYDFKKIREAEGRIFGHAWLENDTVERNGRLVPTAARKSEIRLRLSHWDAGKLKNWQGLEQGAVHHPEVQKTQYKVGPHAYLGFGPLDGRSGTKFKEKINAAIQSGESATLSLAVPDDIAPLVEQSLWLMDRFGTIGGRSRNGWGSFSLTPLCDTPPLDGKLPVRDWKECLTLDWPHAFGSDNNKMLVWQTKPFGDWKLLMKELAEIKIKLRTKFPFATGKDAAHPEQRHWLSYPVTNHSVGPWGGNARLPNSLRFKVQKNADGKLQGVIFHVPCLPPPGFRPEKQAIEQVWTQVHSFLSQQTNLTRMEG